MRKFMFGLDSASPAASCTKLLSLGYDGVVLSASDDISVYNAAISAGLETWMCFGAHSAGENSRQAVDAKGNPAPWFGSACPNDTENNQNNMEKALEYAKNIPGLTGIYVDGARFASFASTEGINSFFGCFCNECMAKMDKMGFNSASIKDGISMLMDHLAGIDGEIPAIRDAVEDWFNFRAACVREYMDNFAEKAHKIGLKAAAFVFAPSLWWFVGQRPETLTNLDIVSPMLYRAYPHEDGPACLSHEWAAFREMVSHASRPADETASLIFDTPLMGETKQTVFSVEHVGAETAAARGMLGKTAKVMPIVQTEDDELDKVYESVMSAGADGCGEFMYSQKKL